MALAHGTASQLHPFGQPSHGFGAHGTKECVPVGEVAIGRIGCHADRTRRLSEHHGVGATLARQLYAGLDEALSDHSDGSLPIRGGLRNR